MATLLPVSLPGTRHSNTTSAFGSRILTSGETRKVRVPLLLRRIIRVSHMVGRCLLILRTYEIQAFLAPQDSELAAWQLTYLCIAPRLVSVSSLFPFSRMSILMVTLCLAQLQ